MSRSTPQANAPASWRPSPLRLVVGLLLAAPLPAMLVAALGVTHEIWLALGATSIVLYALFATTGIVRVSVSGAAWPSNLARACGVGAFVSIATALGFLSFLFAGAPELALLISLGLAIIGMIAGTIFWLCVYP